MTGLWIPQSVVAEGPMSSGLYIDPNIPRFTRPELVSEMDARFGFTDGTFRKYQELGLIGAPSPDQRWTEGRTGSAAGLWSDHDRGMLIAILNLRERQRLEVGGQLDLSKFGQLRRLVLGVFGWLCAARSGSPGTPNLGRSTGGGTRGRARSRSRINGFARQLVDAVAAPGIKLRDRKSMAANLTEKLWANDLDGLLSLEAALQHIIDPDATGRRMGIGPYAADARMQLDGLYKKHLGVQYVIADPSPLRDDDWLLARRLMRQSWASYEVDQPWLAASSENPGYFATATIDYQVSESSGTLLFSLGAIGPKKCLAIPNDWISQHAFTRCDSERAFHCNRSRLLK